MPCVFCIDVRAAGEVIVEDDRLWIVLHNDWSVRGHAMVVWKKHVENISDLTAYDAVHFMTAYHRAERALLAATGAARAIMFKLGVATPHLHVHIYPVSATLDRVAVMGIIDARVREPRDQALVDDLRERLLDIAPSAE